MRVRVVQDSPQPRATAANVSAAVAAVRAAADCDLVVLPELFISGYQLRGLDELALRADGEELAPIRRAAAQARTAVVVGFVEAVAGGVANSALCVDRHGEPAGVYRKTHLFGAERDVFQRGDVLSPIAVDGHDLGIMICFDLEFPEVARSLTRRGADLLVTISANMTPFGREHAVYAEARALENRLPHVYANRVGHESGFDFVGGSCIVDADGGICGRTGGDAAVIDATIAAPGVPEQLAYLQQLRPTLYA